MRFLSALSRAHVVVLAILFLSGCQEEAKPYPLDEAVARDSVKTAMQAWMDGKKPADLKPGIVIGDTAWEKGRKLVSFEIVSNEETSDGSNLHIRVLRKFDSGESKVTYIVGTSPVITIFPQ